MSFFQNESLLNFTNDEKYCMLTFIGVECLSMIWTIFTAFIMFWTQKNLLKDTYYVLLRTLGLLHIVIIFCTIIVVFDWFKQYRLPVIFSIFSRYNIINVYTVHNSCVAAEIQVHLVIAVSRYFAVMKPTTYLTTWTRVKCTVLVIICCSIGVVLENFYVNLLLYLFGFFPSTFLKLGILYEFFCVICMILCYILIGIKFYLQRKSITGIALSKRQKKLLSQAILVSILVAIIFVSDSISVSFHNVFYVLRMFSIELFYILTHNLSMFIFDSKLRQAVVCFLYRKTPVIQL